MPVDSLHITQTVHPVQADTAPVAPFHSLLDTAFTRGLSAMQDTVGTVAMAAEPDWHSGLSPEPRPMEPGNRTGFLILIALMFVLITFNFNHFRRSLKMYGSELWRFRRGRDNVFDEHPGTDTRVLILLLLQCTVCCGILLCSAVCRLDMHLPGAMTGLTVGAFIGVCGIYYLFDLAAYSAVGYTFTSHTGRREWLRGFNASQALLGIALVMPAVVAVFYPPFTTMAVTLAAGLYMAARILFIIKGFRIFYDKFGSLLYFILYLCTLEIIPVIFIYECSRFLVNTAL